MFNYVSVPLFTKIALMDPHERNHNKSSLKKPDAERLNQLAKPKLNMDGRRSQVSNTNAETEMMIPKTLKKLDEHHSSLKKLKYKNQFLQALKDSQSHAEMEEVHKKKW